MKGKVKLDLLSTLSVLLIAFCGFYLKDTLFPPIYATFFVAIAIIVFICVYKNKCIRLYNSILGALFFVIYLVISSFVNGGLTSSLYNVMFSLTYFCVVRMATDFLDEKRIVKASRVLFVVSIILGIFDAVYRFFNPIIKSNYVGLLYINRYKEGGIMYQDGNFVGFYLVIVFFFGMYLRKYKSFDCTKFLFALCMVSVLTFSRTAVFTIIICGYIMSEKISKNVKLLSFSGILVGGIFIYLNYFSKDVSFNSKLYIIERTFSFYLNEMSFKQQLFGVGLGNTYEYIGIGAHNLIVAYVIETGILGMIMLLVLWGLIYRESKKKALMIMLPALLMGFSMAPHFMPYLYCVYALIIALERKSNCSISLKQGCSIMYQ